MLFVFPTLEPAVADAIAGPLDLRAIVGGDSSALARQIIHGWPLDTRNRLPRRSRGGPRWRRNVVTIDRSGVSLDIPVSLASHGGFGRGCPFEEPEELDGEGKHERRVPFGGDLDDSLEQPQL
jgi:hypothetical protein